MQNNFAYMNYLAVACEIISRDAFRAAWLQSPSFLSDAETLYSLHLMTTNEWKAHLKVVHHPLLSKSYSEKIKYEKQFAVIQDALDKQQDLLMRITNYLMDEKPCHYNTIGQPVEIVPYEVFLDFLEHITQKSKELQGESQYF
jgi:hypothetical protein